MENKLNKKVSFVVVNYNGKKYLKRCFDSIYAQTYPRNKIETIMVDNNSKDGSVDFVKKNYPKIKIIRNKVNNYCKANNLGINKAKGKLIFLLNNDTFLKKDCLEILAKEIVKQRKIGAVTGKILFENKKIQSTGHVELPNFYFGDRGFLEKDKGQYNKKGEIKSLCFASVLIKKECIDDVGLLDEDFVMYCEDVDFSIRAGKKGWKLMYIPDAVTYHKFRGTAYILNPEDPDKKEKQYVEVNRLLLLAKHYPDRLPVGLSTSASFYINKEYGFIYDNLGLIMKKLYDNHPKKFFLVLPKFFDELKKVISFEKSLSNTESEINQKLIKKEKQLREKEKRIQDYKKTTERIKKDFRKRENQLLLNIKKIKKEYDKLILELKNKDKQLGEKEKERIKQMKQEEIKKEALKEESKERESSLIKDIEKIKNEFKERELIVLGDLSEQRKQSEKIKEELISKLKDKDKLIHDFYSSRGYRLILEPLNAFYELFVPKKRKK